MEALGTLLVTFVTLVIELTIQAFLCLFHLLMAIFSPRYRQRLRNDWNRSAWQRVGIVLGGTFSGMVVIAALIFWIPVLKNRESQKAEKEPSVTIQFSDDEKQRIEETKEIEELVEVAGTIIMRKLAEQKGESEAQSAP